MPADTEATIGLTEDGERLHTVAEESHGIYWTLRAVQDGECVPSAAGHVLALARACLDALETPEGESLREFLEGIADEYEREAERWGEHVQSWRRNRARYLRTLVGEDDD